METPPDKRGPEFRKIARFADRFMLKVLIYALAATIDFIILIKMAATLH